MAIAVRPARLADALTMAEMHWAAVHALAPGYAAGILDNWAPPVSLERAERLYRLSQDDGALQFVAERDDQPVGFTILSLANHAIEACYVEPGVARQGVGTALLGALEAAALAAGCLALDVRAPATAVPFYLGQGYAVQASDLYRFADGTELPVTLLRRRLG